MDYSLYPDDATQRAWLRRYLEYKYEAEGKDPASVTLYDISLLFVQTNKFALVSINLLFHEFSLAIWPQLFYNFNFQMANFFWAVWALIQSKYSAIDFDYLG